MRAMYMALRYLLTEILCRDFKQILEWRWRNSQDMKEVLLI